MPYLLSYSPVSLSLAIMEVPDLVKNSLQITRSIVPSLRSLLGALANAIWWCCTNLIG